MSMQYVSLLSPGFSGSTLVSMLLCSQPRTIGFGDTYFSHDPKHFPKHPCTCGLWYDECPPRVDSQNAIREGGFPEFEWSRAIAVPVPSFFPRRLRRFWPLMRSASLPVIRTFPHNVRTGLFGRYYRENQLMIDGLERSGKYDFYIDGSKYLVRTELLRSMIPNIKILNVVRHPGAYLYHFHKRGTAKYATQLHHWIRYNNHARYFSRLVPSENYLAVTYESIVQSPAQFLNQIAAFLGMSEINTTDPGRFRRSEIHVIGNRMRETAERVLDYSNTWRGKMPPPIEKMADDTIAQDSWLRSLYEGAAQPKTDCADS
jgi:Sulfotransferase family